MMAHIDAAQWAQLLTALGTFITVIAGLVKSISNGKIAASTNQIAADTNQKVEANTAITVSTHEATNGKMAELLTVVRDAAFKAGQKDQTDRQADITAAVDAAKPKDKI
jgi:mannitol-1-phosphate/altronate dehydrogenase